MAITQLLWANNAATKLASPLTSSSTSATLSTGTGALFPNPSAGQYFLLTLNDALTGLVYEIVKVTARAGDVLTIVRGQEGTAAVAWLANDLAVNMWTAGSAAWLVQESQLQANSYCYAADTGTVNNIVIALTPAITAPNPNAPIYFLAANTNTGATTITVNGGTTYNLLGQAKQALQGGEIPANSFCMAEYDPVGGAYVLLASTGGAVQVGNGTQSRHAPNMGQIQTQAGTAFTTAGTAPAFTLTPTPAITSYNKQRFNVTFNAAGTTGSNTLNISGQGVRNLKQYGQGGVKIPAVIPGSGFNADVLDDGTDLVVLDPIGAGLAASGVILVTSTGSLGASVSGGTVLGNSASATTQTLPAANSMPAGSRIEFGNINTGAMTVSSAGSDTLTVNNTTVTSLVLGAGDTLTLETDGTSTWYAVSGSVQFGYSNVANSSLSGGRKRYPDPNSPTGYITEQWGTSGSVAAGASVAVTFPVAFATAVLVSVATPVGAGVNSNPGGLGLARSLTGLTLYNWGGSIAYSSGVYWYAKGY